MRGDEKRLFTTFPGPFWHGAGGWGGVGMFFWGGGGGGGGGGGQMSGHAAIHLRLASPSLALSPQPPFLICDCVTMRARSAVNYPVVCIVCPSVLSEHLAPIDLQRLEHRHKPVAYPRFGLFLSPVAEW